MAADDGISIGQGPDDLPPAGLPLLDLTTQKIRRPRRYRAGTILTVLLSLAAGGVTGFVVLTWPPDDPLPQQQLTGSISFPPPPQDEVAPTDTPERAERSRRKERQKRKHARVRLKVRSPKRISAPAPVAQAPAPAADSHEPARKREKKHTSKGDSIQWPTTTLYHLYRKRDRQNIYTIDPILAQTARDDDGYKDRLYPGMVYLKSGKGRVRVPVDVYVDYYENSVPAYVFAEEQGAKTFPLFYLTGKQGREVVTSWEHLREFWISKGWTDRGTVGYIYRP